MAQERLSRTVVKGVKWNFLGVYGALAVNFIYTIVLARIVDPADFGRLTFLLQLLTTIVLLSTMGFESAINKFAPVHRVEEQIGKTVDMIRKMVFLKLFVILLLSLAFFLGSDYIASVLLGRIELSLYIKLIGIILIPYGFEGIFRPLLVSYYEMKIASISMVTARLLNLLLATFLILFLKDIAGGLYAELISWSLFIAIVLIGSKKRVFKEKVAPQRVEFKRVMKYSLFLYIFLIMNVMLGQQLTIVLLGVLGPEVEVGFYFIGYNLAFLSVSLFNLALTGGISLTFVSELHAKRDREGLRTAYTVFFEYNYIAMIPIAIGGIIVGQELIGLLYPASYLAALPILIIFFVSFCVIKLGWITSTFMSAMEKEKTLVASRTVFGLSNLALNIILIPTYGAWGAAVATSIAGISSAIYESYIVHRLVSPEYPRTFLAKVLLASLVMAVAVFCTKYFVTDSIFILLIVGLLVYLVMVYLLKPVSRVVLEKMEETGVPLKLLWRKLLG
jgi:O-antigen/teichoic acid export membrane protein